MIIRAKTFRSWMRANFSTRELQEIAQRGADTGWHGLTYTSDTVKLFDRFSDEIWDMAVSDAEDMGSANVAEFISTFRRSDMLGSIDTFKNLMVWYAAEKIAQEFDR